MIKTTMNNLYKIDYIYYNNYKLSINMLKSNIEIQNTIIDIEISKKKTNECISR